MTYGELLKQAEKLNAQAEDLRKQAEAQKQKEKKELEEKIEHELSEARKDLTSVFIDYVETLRREPFNDDEAETIYKTFITLLKGYETRYKKSKVLISVNGKNYPKANYLFSSVLDKYWDCVE